MLLCPYHFAKCNKNIAIRLNRKFFFRRQLGFISFSFRVFLNCLYYEGYMILLNKQSPLPSIYYLLVFNFIHPSSSTQEICTYIFVMTCAMDILWWWFLMYLKLFTIHIINIFPSPWTNFVTKVIWIIYSLWIRLTCCGPFCCKL